MFLNSTDVVSAVSLLSREESEALWRGEGRTQWLNEASELLNIHSFNVA